MSWELFTPIVDQTPNSARVVVHGAGEPMLNDRPRMIRCLGLGAYGRFNAIGLLLTSKGAKLAEIGLDELRVSLDAANAKTFLLDHGNDNIRAFRGMQVRAGVGAVTAPDRNKRCSNCRSS